MLSLIRSALAILVAILSGSLDPVPAGPGAGDPVPVAPVLVANQIV